MDMKKARRKTGPRRDAKLQDWSDFAASDVIDVTEMLSKITS